MYLRGLMYSLTAFLRSQLARIIGQKSLPNVLPNSPVGNSSQPNESQIVSKIWMDAYCHFAAGRGSVHIRTFSNEKNSRKDNNSNLINFLKTVEDLEAKCSEAGIEVVTRQSFLNDPTEAIRNLVRQDARIIVGLFYVVAARRVLCEIFQQKLYGESYVWFLIGKYNIKL